MIRRLGETYRQYQKEVPFIIPRLNRQISAD
jgi:protein-S-isoprenylcysteine O-methyltransferase Ste14